MRVWKNWAPIAAVVAVVLAAAACTPPTPVDPGGADVDPPSLLLPDLVWVTTTDVAGRTVEYSVSAWDRGDVPVAVECDTASGSLFPVGETTVTCAAVDQAGNVASGSFEVRVSIDATPASTLASAGDHVCAVSRGGVSCWGEQLVRLGPSRSYVPRAVEGLTDVTDVAVGGAHGCALGSTGSVRCWGYNFHGALGNGGSSEWSPPVAAAGVSAATSVATGDGHSCAAIADGTVKCWGLNFSGQLGTGDTTDRRRPTTVPGISDATTVAAAGRVTCITHASGQVSCWGSGGTFQLGADNATRVLSPRAIPGITDARRLAVGTGGQTCALTERATVSCWGSNSRGALGDGTTTSRATPTDVVGLSGAVAVAAGRDQSCAVIASGAARCWGSNQRGQLGDRSVVASPIPVEVAGVAGAVSVASGTMTSCAAHGDGGVTCWGDNSVGQVGIGNTGEEDRPVVVPDLGGVQRAATGGEHTCVLGSTGGVRCWGKNDSGQLGIGTTANTPENTRPAAVVDLTEAVGLTAGSWHSCATRAVGTVVCWGHNGFGQLGTGVDSTSDRSPVPVAVVGIDDATSVDAGSMTTCAVRSGGTVSCWGAGTSGQLGDGQQRSSTTPVTVRNLSGAVQVAVGGSFACALVEEGSVWCWGDNSNGSLGDGTRIRRAEPVPVLGIDDAVQLVAGTGHACVRRADGSAACWGDNFRMQIGDGTSTTDALLPADVVGLDDSTHLSAGAETTCSLGADGALQCWGTDFMGQLVPGHSDVQSSVPMEVPGVVDGTSMDSSWSHRCVATRSGQLQCWGGNWDGQLGIGTAAFVLQPRPVEGIS